MDEQKELLQGLWRKAFLQAEPLLIPCKSESNAIRLRFALYNAVREVRKGKGKADKTLIEATNNCTIGFSPGDRATLLVQRKVMTELMQVVVDLVGDASELRKSEEDMEIEASSALLLEKLKQSADFSSEQSPANLGLPRKTHYYTR